ncbi:alpha/beta hydrolase [Sulfuriferula sp. GW1]|uniref:alpha/beta hydrolase n=1 Tax=Sulfuriferula sp. GW1 TaxID=3345111 RepID=UPI0039AFC32C
MFVQYITEGIKKEISILRRDDHDIALHAWRPRQPKGAIFYFHGLQSHAGWVWEAGTQFASNDITLYVLDRRGSGISDGIKNELPPADTLLDDYVEALRFAKRQLPDGTPLCLFGHCLGGSILAALLRHEEFDIDYDNSVFCSAWLGRLHATLTPEQQKALASDSSDDLWDANLEPTDFTNIERYLSYIKNDQLAIRYLTRRSRSVLWHLEEHYVTPGALVCRKPTVFISGTEDPVINLASARDGYRQVSGGEGMILQLPADKHYLFFTEARSQLVNWTSCYVLSRGYHGHA